MQARPIARRARRNTLVFFAAFALASCGPEPPRVAEPSNSLRTDASPDRGLTLVLVTVDGARWQEVFRGVERARGRASGLGEGELVDARALVPNLHGLVSRHEAALGAPELGVEMRASGPNFVSLPGYTELFTGRAPSACRDNSCGAATEPTIVDELTTRFGCAPEEVGVITSWPDIGRVAAMRPDCTTMSSGRHGGFHHERFRTTAAAAQRFDADGRADPFPGNGDFRPDHLTGAQALSYLERYEPRFLFVGLGETDEYAHRGDYRGYLAALSEADRWVGAIARVLSRMAERGRRTALFVTADHGRAASFVDHGAAYPESARVWLVAAGSEIAPRGFPSDGRTRRLADVIPTARRLLGLSPDPSPRAGVPLPEILGERLADGRDEP